MSTQPSAPIIVHHLNNSRSQRILWLLEELNLPYEIKHYHRGSDQRAPKELEAVHSLGKSPVITDGARVVAESGAIIEYIVDKYGKALKPPPGSDDALQYTHWMHFAEGSLMPPLLMTLVFSSVVKQVPFFIRPVASAIASGVHAKLIDPDLARIGAYIERELSKTDYFAGNQFSAADIQMSFPLEAAASRASSFLGPKTVEFVKKIHARPAYQRALEKGGEYAYADKMPC
ncbi:glutathione S-transferase-like protein [Powellomyces hirtus]|nr:glutathione S-transferase-like protein [Powellomyces hirtus]